MDSLRERPIQTKVKHEILERYLEKWGYIIAGGLRGIFKKLERQRREFKIRFIYVDCFSYTGLYAPEKGSNQPVFGSPIIGIESLRNLQNYCRSTIGFTPEIYAVLFEKEKKAYAALLETLGMRNYVPQIKQTTDFHLLQAGDIATVNADFHDYLDSLLRFTDRDFTWSFYLLDPYGPSGIPLDVVSPIISRDRHDVMINFPYLDLHRKTGPAARNDPEQEKHRQYYDAVYGNADWRKLAEPYYADLSDARRDEMEGLLVKSYKSALQEQDKTLAIKTIRLKFPAMERTMFYLFLTTHDPTGAITLNEILDEARMREYELREEHRNVVKRGGQMSLFTVDTDPARPLPSEPEPEDVANEIYTHCKKETIKYREVLQRMIDEPYHHSVIKKAMTVLKRKKLAEYDELVNDAQVRFK